MTFLFVYFRFCESWLFFLLFNIKFTSFLSRFVPVLCVMRANSLCTRERSRRAPQKIGRARKFSFVPPPPTPCRSVHLLPTPCTETHTDNNSSPLSFRRPAHSCFYTDTHMLVRSSFTLLRRLLHYHNPSERGKRASFTERDNYQERGLVESRVVKNIVGQLEAPATSLHWQKLFSLTALM